MTEVLAGPLTSSQEPSQGTIEGLIAGFSLCSQHVEYMFRGRRSM